VKTLISRRRMRGVDFENNWMTLMEIVKKGVKGWHGVKLNQPDWSDHSRTIALSVELLKENLRVYLIFNAYWESLDFELPQIEDGRQDLWRRWIDTSLESPQDIVEWQEAPSVVGYTYRVAPRTTVVLWAGDK